MTNFQREGIRARSQPPARESDYGLLFTAVQRSGLFADSKCFVDCIPLRPSAEIVADYLEGLRAGPAAGDLRHFVEANFIIPQIGTIKVPSGENIEARIATLWRALRREPDQPIPGSSLIPLPHPYIVPGGRFREVYYWDSYFTMLGLREAGEEGVIENMVDNFAWLIGRYGFIPNANRTYYLSRSQPPCFALMVDLLAERRGSETYAHYRDALQAEYDFWMDRGFGAAHVVVLPDGAILNRYYDHLDTPRPEAFVEDEQLVLQSDQPPATLYRNIRSAAESGWDFSSRWFADGRNMQTLQTIALLPVDLNSLLFHLENTLSRTHAATGNPVLAELYAQAAANRARAITDYCWSDAHGFFCDYQFVAGQPSAQLSLAGLMPLFFRIATATQADAVARKVREHFLQPGGVVTTLQHTGQQWDAPNGWAPLQWITIRGLQNYGHHELAAEITRRWVKLNRDVYARTGKLMEKYNVVDVALEAGGGEYPTQDGFGWTNGVLLRLLRS